MKFHPTVLRKAQNLIESAVAEEFDGTLGTLETPEQLPARHRAGKKRPGRSHQGLSSMQRGILWSEILKPPPGLGS